MFVYPTMTDLREQATVLALTEAAPGPWYEISELLEDAGGAQAILAGNHTFYDTRAAALAEQLAERVTDENIAHWQDVIERTLAATPGTRLLTAIDPDYPANLRRVYDRPPFLFVRGDLREEDDRAIAVVGTRQASSRGLGLARKIATMLAERGVTVISGLAAGIDTAAHTAALEAGGRTLAVMGTGIDKVYPAPNRLLADRITEHGALLSQFWPGSPPRGSNFPLRNVVTSGVAVGTVVVEASSTSGAKMQARLALEHGKGLFLVRSLVMQEQWAQRYATRRGALVVDSVDDIVSVLDREREPVSELQLF